MIVYFADISATAVRDAVSHSTDLVVGPFLEQNIAKTLSC